MTRAKPKRGSTRAGGTNVGKKPTRAPLPEDLADAAEAALDDLLSQGSLQALDEDDDDNATRMDDSHRKGRVVSTNEVGIEELIPIDVDDDEGDDPLTRARSRRMPSRVKPLAEAKPADPPPSLDSTNPVEQSDVEEIEDEEPPTAFAARQRESAVHLPAPPLAPARISQPMATPVKTSAHTIARSGNTPPSGSRPTPTPLPPVRPLHTPTPTPAPLPTSRPSRLPLPAPTESRLVDAEATLEKTTGLRSADEAAQRKAWLESAQFEQRPPTELDDGDLVLDSAPFDRPRSEVVFGGPLDDALAGLDNDASSRFEIQSLRFAIYEDSAYRMSAESAIAQAGHIVAISGAGRDALTRVGNALHEGGIDVLLVSLPGGESLIDIALACEPHRPTIIASLSSSSVEAVSAATASGADLATTRPHDVERIAPLALAASRIDAITRVAIAARGAEQVLRQRLEDIADAEPGGLLPFEHFQRTLEIEIKRAKRFNYPLSVALFAVEVEPPPPPAGILGILRARAGNALINTIRDIDIATQLDHERFLVLLPYTDLKGAGSVGRRVISAVAKGQPVISDGRSIAPRVIGGCAAMKKGDPVSFAKLMKDATRALESARRDGDDLAVQP